MSGGHAEYMVAYADATMLLPEGLDYEQAAPIFCAGYTVWSGLRWAEPQPNCLLALEGGLCGPRNRPTGSLKRRSLPSQDLAAFTTSMTLVLPEYSARTLPNRHHACGASSMMVHEENRAVAVFIFSFVRSPRLESSQTS